MPKRVLSLGQCFADASAIARTLQQHYRTEVISVDTVEEALQHLETGVFALVLVNRLLDADGASGVEFIRRLKANERLRDVPVMLVSNYEDAQQQAEEAGAIRGFGKAALGQPQILERIKTLLESPEEGSVD
jgi:two-component system chemotaxis response regulator CheY